MRAQDPVPHRMFTMSYILRCWAAASPFSLHQVVSPVLALSPGTHRCCLGNFLLGPAEVAVQNCRAASEGQSPVLPGVWKPPPTRRVRKDEVFRGHRGLCPGGAPGVLLEPEAAPLPCTAQQRGPENPPTRVISPFPVRSALRPACPRNLEERQM